MEDKEARQLKMKPILDRIPEAWGKYLPEAGWDNLLLALNNMLVVYDEDYIIQQAKEKFGTLRFHFDFSEEFKNYPNYKETRLRLYGMIQAIEFLSSRTCEYCGSMDDTVKLRQNGWIKTLCDKCQKERYE